MDKLELIKHELIAAFDAVCAMPRPDMMLVGGWQYVVMKACLDNQGRDRRRVKREMNKAGKKYRRAERHGTA